MQISHQNLTQLATCLGFPDNEGICQGFTLTWALAVLCGEEEQFYARLSLIKKFISDNYYHLTETLNAIKEKVKTREPLNTREQKILDIQAWIEQVIAFQKPFEFSELFNKSYSQKNIVEIFNLVRPEQLESRELSVPFDKIYAGDKTAFILFFQQLKKFCNIFRLLILFYYHHLVIQ